MATQEVPSGNVGNFVLETSSSGFGAFPVNSCCVGAAVGFLTCHLRRSDG